MYQVYRLAYNGPSTSHLAAGDPTNTEWQRDLSVSHEKIGDGQSAQGGLKAALSSYQIESSATVSAKRK